MALIKELLKEVVNASRSVDKTEKETGRKIVNQRTDTEQSDE